MKTTELLYEKRRMEVLVEEDALIRLVVKDLVGRGSSRDEALELAFTSYVLDDLTMSKVYQSV